MTVTLETLNAKLDKLLGDAATVLQTDFVFPGPDGLAVVDGCALWIDEPIRADWKVSMEARTFTRQGRIGHEPSNAFDSGLPKRSPAGYPMIYGVGMYGPVAPGRVLYDGSTFASDAEVEAYKKDAQARLGNLVADDRARVNQIYIGTFPAASSEVLEQAGYVYAYTQTGFGTRLANKIYREAGIFSGTFHDIARLIQAGDLAFAGKGNAARYVSEWPDTPLKRAVMAVTV